MNIALALIKRLVAIGQIDADDIAAICEELDSPWERTAVQAAWVAGAAPDEEFKPTLKIVE